MRRAKLAKRISCGSQHVRDTTTMEILEIKEKIMLSHKVEQTEVEKKVVDTIKRNSKFFFSFAK